MPRVSLGVLPLFAAVCILSAANADDASFMLRATARQPYTPAYLGNGVISLVSTPLGTEPAHTFLTGVYDHSPHDVMRLASAPAWNEVDINNGSHWLNALGAGAMVQEYSQTLDMHSGVLRTGYVWVDGSKRLRVGVEQFVARNDPSLAGVQVTITPSFSGSVNVRLPLRNWPPPHRYALEELTKQPVPDQWAIWYPGHLTTSEVTVNRSASGMLMTLLCTAPGTGVRTGESVAVEWTGNAQVQTRKDVDSAEAVLSFTAVPGESRTFTKLAAISSFPIGSDVLQTSRERVVQARVAGWAALLSSSVEAWHKLWNADVIVDGDTDLQRIIHSMLFYLVSSAQAGLEYSIGPMGLSSDGYCGHIFWDTEIFMYQPLLMLHPEMAKSLVAFRSRTLQAARENATKNGYRGAMYPWEAGPEGQESTPHFAAQNASAENHINGDVALAAWEYWAATGDTNWLRNQGWPILRDTADFWASRVMFNAQQHRYEIAGVVGVNESQIGISNDAYTNGIAKKNLELATSVGEMLHIPPNPKWRDIAKTMYEPSSDSALLWYPLGRTYPRDQTVHAIDLMLSHMQNRAIMGTQFYTILAAEIGDRHLITELLGPLSKPFLRPP
ncbi:MAG TPA: hypothetical protein VH302_06655, partial [Bryobacteraceae bacterium]|nr:hypothetical protein [Bryobacteraceae bacterium]